MTYIAALPTQGFAVAPEHEMRNWNGLFAAMTRPASVSKQRYRTIKVGIRREGASPGWHTLSDAATLHWMWPWQARLTTGVASQAIWPFWTPYLAPVIVIDGASGIGWAAAGGGAGAARPAGELITAAATRVIAAARLVIKSFQMARATFAWRFGDEQGHGV